MFELNYHKQLSKVFNYFINYYLQYVKIKFWKLISKYIIKNTLKIINYIFLMSIKKI